MLMAARDGADPFPAMQVVSRLDCDHIAGGFPYTGKRVPGNRFWGATGRHFILRCQVRRLSFPPALKQVLARLSEAAEAMAWYAARQVRSAGLARHICPVLFQDCASRDAGEKFLC
jgi:hypothetical protein